MLAELKTGLEVATRRTDEYHRLATQFKLYQDKLQEVENTKTDRTNDLQALARTLSEYSETEQSFIRLYVENAKCARFTKAEQFLKTRYQER